MIIDEDICIDYADEEFEMSEEQREEFIEEVNNNMARDCEDSIRDVLYCFCHEIANKSGIEEKEE